MGPRKYDDDVTEPVLSNTKAARTLGLVLIIVGVVGVLLQLSGAGSLFFLFVGIGIILLSTSSQVMHWAALGCFGIALVSLGFALCRLLG